MKKLLCIISRPPYTGSHDIELVETGLVGAVFDFSVSLLFRDDGVWALLPNQNGSLIGRRTLSKLLTALPTYEINDVYVCADSIASRGLSADVLVDSVIPITLEDQAQLIGSQDAVIGAQP
jgi:tRNA 2-thiouridine synthesizing protein C